MENKNHKEDVIEIKPKFGPFILNVRALLRRLTEKPTIDPVGIVAQRFIQIFEDHGVNRTQIPKLLPKITLDKLTDSNALLSLLTPDVLDQTANMFGVRKEWLEGLGAQIYQPHWCYKHPEMFFEDIASLDFKNTMWSIRILSQTDFLDYRKTRKQPLVIVLAEKIETWGEKEIYKYTVYGDGWDWNYWKCRIQIKAMMRVIFERHGYVLIPIFKVSPKTLKEIDAGWIVPHYFFRRRLHKFSLEDFCLSPEESAVSKESEELPQVFGYIEAFGLHKLIGLKEKKTPENKWSRNMFL